MTDPTPSKTATSQEPAKAGATAKGKSTSSAAKAKTAAPKAASAKAAKAPAAAKTTSAPKAAAASSRKGKAAPKAAESPDPAPAQSKAAVARTPAKSGATTGTKSSTKAAATKAGTAKAAPAKAATAKAGTAKSSADKPSAAKGKTAKANASAASSAKAAAPKAAAAAAARPKAAASGKGTGKGAGKKTATTKATPAAKSGTAPWLASYPKGIAAEIGPLEHQSIADLLVASCRQYSSRPAFTCMGREMAYGELETLSAQFGAYLQSTGLAKGSRVAIMMPNILQYPVAMMGALRAGYTIVNVNPLYTPRELEHQLNDSGAEAIVILENFAHTLQAVKGKTKVKHVVVASMGDLMGSLKGFVVNLVVRRVRKMVPSWNLPGHVKFNAALSKGKSGSLRKIVLTPDDYAFLQYTGGTTGVSKGAALTHGNVLSNVAQNELWVQALFNDKKRPDQLVYICALPLYHIFALTVNAMMGMQQGAHNILIPNPRDIPGFVKELQSHKFHIFPGLNTLFNALLNNDDFKKIDFKPLMLTIGGGMAVQAPVAERWKKLTGSTICEGYGLSETSPVATANRFDSTEFTGTIGLPLPSTEIVIRDEDGKDVKLGEIGEICIRGPQVMKGYWNRDDETAKVMTKDGFFRSGDMGFMDERGYVKIVDRKKDMILVSGFNVYPNEIEEVVVQHPGVLEVAAIGVPDEKSGEVPKLFVVKKDDKVTAEEIIEFTKDKLTAYKRPKHVEFRKELPKTNVGKILRRELR
ncbi:long-chain-fatty-acid--CoA ligase [Chelativorans sp. ZYF759]|nr:long-chain-fatty-acid--CoA ligase [Chelativorans sp. ZYF759]NMG41003.1 long-chain-fatty-acid--CoA ligase [Chelativorans sp. ZYF759]